MENFELNISIPPKRKNNWFPKGNIPFNKDIPMKDWMDGRKIKKVIKCLKLGRIKGNERLACANRKMIVGIKDGKLIAFRSALDAEKYIRCLGIKISRRNINSVCNGKVGKFKFGKYEYNYIRRKAGGYRWFFASDVEKYKDLVEK